MDSLAFRLANALVGNDSEAAGLEITLSGKAQHAQHAYPPCTVTCAARREGLCIHKA